MRKKILVVSNPLWVKTGLSRNARSILINLYNEDKYDIVQYCQSTYEDDPRLEFYPWKCYGAIPRTEKVQKLLKSHPDQIKIIGYGGYNIDNIIEKEKPDILWMSDDIWAFPVDQWGHKPWVNKDFNDPSVKTANGCTIVQQITVDSLPISDDFFEMAKTGKTYVCAPFAEREAKKVRGCEHVKTIPNSIDESAWVPISKEKKRELRSKFNISQDDIIFFFLARNQSRKLFPDLIKAYSEYKKENPETKARLYFHCSWQEGWPLEKIIKSYPNIKKEDILTTYVCSKCGEFEIKPYNGEQLDCLFCGAKKTQITANIKNGVEEEEMKYLYGISDAAFSMHNSGGFEMHQAQALFCGLPLATIEYSCGEHFAEQDFVWKINYTETREPKTGFIKAVPVLSDVIAFFSLVERMNSKEIEEIAKRGIEWANLNFSSKNVFKMWKNVFDECPKADYSEVGIKRKPNYDFKPDYTKSDIDFIKEIYKEILCKEITEKSPEMENVLNGLNKGFKKQDIYKKAIDKARQVYGKDDEEKLPDGKNLLMVMPETDYAVFIASSLIKPCLEKYPDYNIFIAVDKRHKSLIPLISKNMFTIEKQDFMKDEIKCIGKGFDVYINTACMTEGNINFLTKKNALT